MKALSLTQPWATLIAIGAKRIETRSWRTEYRGLLAIHAAKHCPRECKDLCLEWPFRRVLAQAGIRGVDALPLGAIIAVGELYDCRRTESLAAKVDPEEAEFGDYSFGRYGFMLRDVRRLVTPVSIKGRLGLWDWPARLACEEQAK